MRGLKQTEQHFVKLEAQLVRNRIASNRAAAIIVKRAIKAEAKKIRGRGIVVGTTSRGKPRVRHPLESTVRLQQVGENFLVGPHTPLAHLVIGGHKPPSGPILPVAARALSWTNGGTVFAASSPGGTAAPNPFVERALTELVRVEAITAAREVLINNLPEPADT